MHYLGDMIEDYIEKTGRHANVSILREESPLGTAGAISMLPEINSGNLVVANCDLISNLDMNDLVQFHLESKSEATLAAATHKLQIPYGVLRHNAFGLFEKIEEKPVLSNYVAAGICIFSQIS